MEREILFRGKQVDTGEWVQGSLIYDEISETTAIVTYVNLSGNTGQVIDLSEINCYTVIPEMVGQYTGLTDKNGNRIFEGDIVADVNCEYDKYVVKFSDERCGFFPFAKGDGCGCCEVNVLSVNFAEVIGNIHDNPELLRYADVPVSSDISQPVLQPATPENFELREC